MHPTRKVASSEGLFLAPQAPSSYTSVNNDAICWTVVLRAALPNDNMSFSYGVRAISGQTDGDKCERPAQIAEVAR